jgi:DNA excision repair protein ERCC-2
MCAFSAACTALLLKMADVTPDGVVAFFPSYSYMTNIISKWHSVGILSEIQVRL